MKRDKRKSRSGAEHAKEEMRLSEKVCRALDIPPDLLPGEGVVEIRGRGVVTVKGSGKILLYTPEEICVEMKKGMVSVRGQGLVCTSYHREAIDIEGRIYSVSFGNGCVCEQGEELDGGNA